MDQELIFYKWWKYYLETKISSINRHDSDEINTKLLALYWAVKIEIVIHPKNGFLIEKWYLSQQKKNWSHIRANLRINFELRGVKATVLRVFGSK